MQQLHLTDNDAGPGDAWWERSLGIRDVRAERYSAFSRILRFPETVPVRSLVVAADIVASDTSETSERALSWAQNVNESMSLAVEHIRLFGGFGVPGATNCLVAARDMHAEARRAVEQISQAYRRFGYWAEDSACHPFCPAHASNAFGFMAHCLLVGDLGVPEATREAELFHARFLSHWMPGFADAIRSAAIHPVTQLLGVALAEFASQESARALHRA